MFWCITKTYIESTKCNKKNETRRARGSKLSILYHTTWSICIPAIKNFLYKTFCLFHLFVIFFDHLWNIFLISCSISMPQSSFYLICGMPVTKSWTRTDIFIVYSLHQIQHFHLKFFVIRTNHVLESAKNLYIFWYLKNGCIGSLICYLLLDTL